MIIKTFSVGMMANNNFLVIDDESKEAVLIDATAKIGELKSVLDEYGATLKYILLTHGHFDHIMGVNSINKDFNAKVLVHKDDKQIIDESDDFMMSVGLEPFEHPVIDEYIDESTEIKIGNTPIKVIHLPGHTQGGVGYLIEDKLFSGDTVFLESIGRTDLVGGNYQQLVSSIKEKVFALPDKTTIYTGHGTNTTVDHEKKYNDFI